MKRLGATISVALMLFHLLCFATARAEERVFATVNGHDIAMETYERAVASGAKSRFYHGAPPEQQMQAFRREVGQRLIADRLLLEEARRRGIPPDDAWVEQQVALFEMKLAEDPQWRKERKSLLPGIRTALAEQSRVRRLVEKVEDVPAPSASALRAFYDRNHDLFTEPERIRVSSILLKVEPWASTEVWEEADAEAGRLLQRLRGGASFAELARLHSQDASAKQGGDLGYVHKGMLGEAAQQAIDTLKPGQVSAPVRLLEGVGIFRLDERIPPQLSPFDDVRERAADLWTRERRAEELERLRERLFASADIQVHDPEFRRWWESGEGKTAAASSPAR